MMFFSSQARKSLNGLRNRNLAVWLHNVDSGQKLGRFTALPVRCNGRSKFKPEPAYTVVSQDLFNLYT